MCKNVGRHVYQHMYFYLPFGFGWALLTPVGVPVTVWDMLWTNALVRGGAEVVDGLSHHLGVDEAAAALRKHPSHRERLQVTAQLTQISVPGRKRKKKFNKYSTFSEIGSWQLITLNKPIFPPKPFLNSF